MDKETHKNGQITPEYAKFVYDNNMKVLEVHKDEIIENIGKLEEMGFAPIVAFDVLAFRYWELCEGSDIATVSKVLSDIYHSVDMDAVYEDLDNMGM